MEYSMTKQYDLINCAHSLKRIKNEIDMFLLQPGKQRLKKCWGSLTADEKVEIDALSYELNLSNGIGIPFHEIADESTASKFIRITDIMSGLVLKYAQPEELAWIASKNALMQGRNKNYQDLGAENINALCAGPTMEMDKLAGVAARIKDAIIYNMRSGHDTEYHAFDYNILGKFLLKAGNILEITELADNLGYGDGALTENIWPQNLSSKEKRKRAPDVIRLTEAYIRAAKNIFPHPIMAGCIPREARKETIGEDFADICADEIAKLYTAYEFNKPQPL
jgi:hypothetical protein